MIQMHSFCLDEYKKKKFVNLDNRKSENKLYCSNYEIDYYTDILKSEKSNILHNCHKYIDLYVDNDKNIFNGEIKFNENSIIEYEDIFIAVCCSYTLNYITIEMYVLNKLPHIMTNDDLFFDNFSIIKRYKKIFNITSFQMESIFKQNLKNILYNLFDLTFTDMIK